MDNNTNFYISGFIAFTLFALIFFLFAILLSNPQSSKTFALKKDKFISISLVSKTVVIPKEKKQEISKPVEENIDINNLFSDVWTKKILPKKEQVKPKDSKRLFAIQKKIQKSTLNDVEAISHKKNKETEQTSTADEVNEYLAKIQAIVYQHFRVPANSEGSSVKTVIELNALGRVLDFRVLNYSANEALNAEADKIRERLMYITFPSNPEKKSSRTIVILISKE
ncbi:TonB C-terminal domain-containing protein [Sulfurimonas sp. SAG-AH-194-C21]|nr:TonB C-terminal domain-containing protein [Sulfurimonas sp. SAG-AH-194-C21]MDF1882798.1 TonB C-terminal domain-containing protein [Sulfurimonas sp. SAG-AH-194-C21]